MATTYSVYSVDAEIDAFFAKTSATRSACDARALELAAGRVVTVEVQDACSYSVYAGPDLEFVVQFRLEPLGLQLETAALAKKIYGDLVPGVSFEGQVGDQLGDREPLCVYLMGRVRGVTHLDFILARGFPENYPENLAWRRTLMQDVARFFALSWKTPQPVDPARRSQLRQTYVTELQLLLSALPQRFRRLIQTCIDCMDDILSLPMVLLHRDFGSCNIMVDEASCHLAGVIDWAEADVCPFGLNLYSLQSLTGKLHLRNGWARYEDYSALQAFFWAAFEQEVGELPEDCVRTIKLARILGLLLSKGFTSRLGAKAEPVPIGDDEDGRYNMLSLDGFLINIETRFEDIRN